VRVLITGGAGFIGLHLARTLARRGHTIALVDAPALRPPDDDLQAFLSTGGHTLFEADLTRPGALDSLASGADVICHLAAILGVQTVRDKPFAVLQDNVAMTTETLKFAARQPAIHRFVFASTSEVYAGTLRHFSLVFPTPETTPLTVPNVAEPRSTYMLSKIYGEALVQQSGLPFTIIRPHSIYGPRMGFRHVMPQLMQRIIQSPPGQPLVVYSPEHCRTFCFIDDAVDLIAAAIDVPAAGGATLNVGTEQPEVSMLDLARLIGGVLGREIQLEPGPVTPGSPVRRQPDIRRIVEVTGVDPRVSLEEGVRRTWQWYEPRLTDGVDSASGSLMRRHT
jgi:UDP-glucuronate decarboxylase